MNKSIHRGGHRRKPVEALQSEDGGHVMILGPLRTGKGRGLIIPALLTRTLSCLVIDPKGDLCAIRRKHGQQSREVLVLNPFNIAPKKPTRKSK